MVILVVSLGALVALVGYLAIDLLAGTTDEPAIQVEVRTREPGNDAGGWLVPVRVRNTGGRAALDIILEGRATVEGAEESSQVTIALLAADSAHDLVLGFSARPVGEVSIRIVSYTPT
jgi:uncharacterized protein (TIGR02588 family)